MIKYKDYDIINKLIIFTLSQLSFYPGPSSSSKCSELTEEFISGNQDLLICCYFSISFATLRQHASSTPAGRRSF
jgi:hypothetical protein